MNGVMMQVVSVIGSTLRSISGNNEHTSCLLSEVTGV